eukprot:TRINITY_DN6984_c0_g1_i1.p1 TRINITY_DN6984_c0_g1~~TRINITY_DN6984_c0_g1_i1.p1  ORF type:complete len:103 (+),score=10.35 TRINITY_DN6984_c0_g1_i1:175-483(+)
MQPSKKTEKTGREGFKYFGGKNETEKSSSTWQKWIQRHRNIERYTALQAAVAWNKLKMLRTSFELSKGRGLDMGTAGYVPVPLNGIDTTHREPQLRPGSDRV